MIRKYFATLAYGALLSGAVAFPLVAQTVSQQFGSMAFQSLSNVNITGGTVAAAIVSLDRFTSTAGASTTYVSSTGIAMYRTGSGGSFPFNTAGNMVLESRALSGAGIGLATGATMSVRAYLDSAGHLNFLGTAPGSLTGCGSGASIVGNDNAGRITIGTTPGASCAITFATGWTTNIPSCFAQNETASNLLRATPTLTTLTMTGTLAAANVINYRCTGML